MTGLASRWKGAVIPAVPVPFDADKTIAEGTLEAYVAWMKTQRVAAVAVGVHTGRGLLLSTDQQEMVVRHWKRGGHDLVCGAGVPERVVLPTEARARTDAVIHETVAMAEWAKVHGAAAVLIYPPSAIRDLPDAQDRAVALHRAVAHVGLPSIAFLLYEAAGGIDYDDRSLECILDIEGVIGVKLATLDRPDRFREVTRLIAQTDQHLCITGEDRFLGMSVAAGADCALIGMAAACTDRMVDLFERARAGDHDGFDVLAAHLDAFAAVGFADPVDGYVQRMLWALEADGVVDGEWFDPFGPSLGRAERERVFAAVQALRSD